MKSLKMSLSVTLAALLLTACGSVSSSAAPTLTTITLGGVGAVEVEFDAPFNLKTGVTATGDNNEDYTSLITLASISEAVNLMTGVLDSTKTGVHAVRYTVTVGSIVAQQWRNITVLQPDAVQGMMVQNGDFSLGTAQWNNPPAYFELDGGQFASFTVVEGELRLDIVASGSQVVFPRFGQMNIPFLQGKTYKVSFDARSSVSRPMAVQVGRLLPNAPWFDDFLDHLPTPAERIYTPTLTTSMAEYSFTFTMNKNDLAGGILFGFGTIAGQTVNALIHMDNIEIVEVSA
jgi:hypothetical protein